jgi:ABC-type lipoprotein release transport system permease subunit
VQLRIVGVAKNQQEDGTVLFVPLTTVRSVLGEPTGASTYWIRTSTRDHALVDRTTTRVEDRLAALGYDVGTEVTYVAERDEVAANRTITTSIALLGFVIVAMSMVGLANAITTNVLERTREIGILRCIGARARDVRRIFTTEGVTLALAGWLLGVPFGYVLDRLLVWLVWQVVDVRMPVAFPPRNLLIALVGTVVLALLVLLLPVRRAVRFRPAMPSATPDQPTPPCWRVRRLSRALPTSVATGGAGRDLRSFCVVARHLRGRPERGVTWLETRAAPVRFGVFSAFCLSSREKCV